MTTNITVIAPNIAHPCRISPTILPKAKHRAGGDQEDRDHLEEIGQRGRVFIRMRGIGVEEAAAIGAQHLDRFLRGDRAHGDRLRLGGQVSVIALPFSSFNGWPSAPFFGCV